MKPIGTNIERNIKRSMFDYVPKMYEEYPESVAIIETEADEFDLLHTKINDVLAQFNIDTATWGLVAYEYDIGIKNTVGSSNMTFKFSEENDLSFADLKPYTWSSLLTGYPQFVNQRRETIKAKHRGVGTVTPQLIKNVVETYSNGEVEVIEKNAEYGVVIKFIGEYGAPVKIGEIQSLLREIIPAHLTIDYEYKYVTYNQSKDKYVTYDDMKNSGHTYEQLLISNL